MARHHIDLGKFGPTDYLEIDKLDDSGIELRCGEGYLVVQPVNANVIIVRRVPFDTEPRSKPIKTKKRVRDPFADKRPLSGPSFGGGQAKGRS